MQVEHGEDRIIFNLMSHLSPLKRCFDTRGRLGLSDLAPHRGSRILVGLAAIPFAGADDAI